MPEPRCDRKGALPSLRLLVLGVASVLSLTAADYRGSVKVHGLPMPGATITASHGETKAVTTTDERGEFAFSGLAEGIWNVQVEMLGFEKTAREVHIAPSASPEIWELKFQPRQTAAPPASTPRPQFRSVQVGQSVENLSSDTGLKKEEIPDLSQSSANAFLVQGSVSSALGLGAQNDWGFGLHGPGMEMAGGAGMIGSLVPGMGNDDKSPGSGLQQGSRGPAEMGSPDGMRMVVGPGGPGGGPPPGGPPPGGMGMGGPGMFGSGRRGWQGRPDALAFGNARRDPRGMYMASAFFGLDNSVWDARTFSVTGASLDKPAYANARGGLMFGGPLFIPKLVSAKKRILFTFDYQFQRNRTGTNSDPVNMPTALERSGDFSQTLLQGASVTVYDPTTGTPFPGNQIPATRINSSAAALLKYYPEANLPYAARNYQTSWTGVNNSQNLNSRIANLKVGDKNRLNANFGYQGSRSTTPNLFQFVDTGSGRALSAGLGWSRNITTTLINNLRYSFSRNRQLSSPYFANLENVASELGISGTSQVSSNWGPPSLSFSNYAGLNDGNYSLNRSQTSGLGESLMWIRGTHTLRWGGDYRRQQFNQLSDANGRGSFSFNGSATSYYLDGVAQSGTGYDLADFLLGTPTTSSIRYGNSDKYFRSSGYDFFLNDDWRVNTRLSLSTGLRWDYASPVSELYNRMINLVVAPDYSGITAVTAPNTLIRPDRNNISPRFGLAWRPLPNDSLVVRGGYGVYYNTSVYNVVAANLAQQPPFAQTLSISGSTLNPLNIQTAFLLASSHSLASTYAIDPDYRIGYAQTWTLSLQHNLPFSMFATAGYLGIKGTRLDQQFIPNSVAPGAVESTYPHGFTYETSNGNSIYHAAQFQLHRRFHSGIMAHASYQFAKSIDNAGTGGRGQGSTPVAQNWLDLSAERGLSSFDARHNLSAQLQYSTGMGMAGGTLASGWRSKLWKDWTISANISLRSGNPFTATVAGNRSQVSGTGVTSTVRASATGESLQADGLLFNTAAFTEPAAGEWGNAGRNTVPGPTTFYLNGSLGRVIRLGERRSVDLQMQSQNLLNHVTITSWGTVVGSANYGLATNAAAMRKLTANIRFRF